MKKIYLIQSKVQENQTFENRIKSLGSWIKYFDTNWIIESELSSSEIYKKLSIGFENESMFIIELDKSNFFGRMNTKVWDYLQLRK